MKFSVHGRLRTRRFTTGVVLGLAVWLVACLAFVPAVVVGAAGEGAGQSPQTLTILHTNDTHAHLEYIARRATLIGQIREQEPNVLLVDAGDVFSGTLYFTQYLGRADLEFMNLLGYDAMTLGNHEFDKGPAGLAPFVAGARFPVVSANVDVAGDPDLGKLARTEIGTEAGWVYPAVIREVAGEKVGIIGLTTPEASEISSPGPHISFSDPVAVARQLVDRLTAMGVDRIVVLSHLGWPRDLELAAAVEGIDVIVGGHTHTVPEEYPTVVTADGTPTLVVQAGAEGKYLGRLDVTFDEEGVPTAWQGGLTAVDRNENNQFVVPEEPQVAARLAEYNAALAELRSRVVGRTAVALDGERARVRAQETNLGNLIADAMLAKAAPWGARIAITNGGGIRASIDAGEITLGEVLTVMPFGNTLMVTELTGAQIVEALENGVSQVESGAGRFPQVAGLRFVWDPKQAPGKRVVKVEVRQADGTYQPIDLTASYRVATNNFMYAGGDGYRVFTQGRDPIEAGFVDYEVLVEYLQAHTEVDPQVEGRIVQVE